MHQAGDYQFRMHADYGQGSFIGVDGAEYTPGDLWGHVNIDASTLTAGEHEFDVLGFEPCCDGHAELEVHLPCDKEDSPWRIVVQGDTDCMMCASSPVDASCSMDTDSAACCGASGGHTICHERLPDGTCDTATEDPGSIAGRFIALSESMTRADAAAYCSLHYAGLASIHTREEQRNAATACRHFADPSGDEGTVRLKTFFCIEKSKFRNHLFPVEIDRILLDRFDG